MGLVFLFLVLMMILSSLFKRVAAVATGIPFALWRTIKGDASIEGLMEKPEILAIIGVFNHATIGALDALLISICGVYFVFGLGGNFWLYFALSMAWAFRDSIGLHGKADGFFFACVGGIPVIWFLGVYYLIALWALLLIGFVPIYIKRTRLIFTDIIESGDTDYIPPDPGIVYDGTFRTTGGNYV